MLSLAKARRLAWERGALTYKLDANQRELYRRIDTCGRKRFVANCSRRIGKTFAMALRAEIVARKKPKARVVMLAPTLKDLETLVLPAFEKIHADCPPDLLPRWRAQKSQWIYPNGSIVRLVGCDDRRKANRARGAGADLVLIDEAGSNPELHYLVTSVLGAYLLETGGTMIIASTPPDSEGHPFVEMVSAAKATGAYFHCTIYDCPRYSPEQVESFIAEEASFRGMAMNDYKESVEYRREFLGELLTDPEKAVIPEATHGLLFGDAKHPVPVVREVQPPPFIDRYVAMDVGWSPDFTGVLFGYWDAAEQRGVIQEETLMRRMGTPELAFSIALTETELWLTNERKPTELLMRHSDVAPQLIYDLQAAHDLLFFPTDKDDRDAAIAKVRRWLNSGKLVIHPRCVRLIEQIRFATWNNSRTEFTRSQTHGHFDLLAALIIWCRNVSETHDPMPADYGLTDLERARRRSAGIDETLDKDTAALARIFA